MSIHIVPRCDRIEHTPCGSCCNAFTDEEGIVNHHSADKREQFERVGIRSKGWEIRMCFDDEVKYDWE